MASKDEERGTAWARSTDRRTQAAQSIGQQFSAIFDVTFGGVEETKMRLAIFRRRHKGSLPLDETVWHRTATVCGKDPIIHLRTDWAWITVSDLRHVDRCRAA
jgi:hypothetical protein